MADTIWLTYLFEDEDEFSLYQSRNLTKNITSLCEVNPLDFFSQYEDPKNIFLPGESCSKCDENYGCDEKLCVSCHESPSACATTTPVTTSPQQSKFCLFSLVPICQCWIVTKICRPLPKSSRHRKQAFLARK